LCLLVTARRASQRDGSSFQVLFSGFSETQKNVAYIPEHCLPTLRWGHATRVAGRQLPSADPKILCDNKTKKGMFLVAQVVISESEPKTAAESSGP